MCHFLCEVPMELHISPPVQLLPLFVTSSSYLRPLKVSLYVCRLPLKSLGDGPDTEVTMVQ
jgi:hypothetical protein